MNEHDAMVARKRRNSFDSDDPSFWQTQSVAVPFFFPIDRCACVVYYTYMYFFFLVKWLSKHFFILIFSLFIQKTLQFSMFKQMIQTLPNSSIQRIPFFAIKCIKSLNKGK